MADLFKIAQEKGLLEPADVKSETVIDDAISRSPGRRRPWLEEKPLNKPTEILQKTYRKSTEKPTEKTSKTYRKPTENVQETAASNSEFYRKPTGRPTGKISETYRNSTENLQENVYSSKDVSSLSGKQKSVFLYLVNRAKIFGSEGSSGDRLTPKISAREILEDTHQTSVRSAREVVRELMKSRLVRKESIKSGPGGWTIYAIDSKAYSKSLVLETYRNSTEILQKTYRKPTGQPTERSTEILSSSSSGLNFKSTITSNEMWKTLDLSVVEKIGVNEAAVFEARQKFGPFSFVDFETLIDRFSKYVTDPKMSRKISNPRGFFFGLCKQMQAGIEPLSEVETESDKAMKEYLLKAKAEKAAREQRDLDILDLEFCKWFENLDVEEKARIEPESGLVKVNTPPYRALFKDYFERELWDEKREHILRGEC